MGADNRLVGQIHPNEFYAMVDWRRFDSQIDFLARVKSDTRAFDMSSQGPLIGMHVKYPLVYDQFVVVVEREYNMNSFLKQ
jgi:hypothetical protein